MYNQLSLATTGLSSLRFKYICWARVGNLFTIMGRITCGLSLAGRI